MNEVKPPALAKRFFQWYCKAPLQESILGDLEEQFEEDVDQYGPLKAKRRFVWNVIRFFRPGIIKNFEGTQKLNYYGMFKHFLSISWRNLVRNKTYSAINIVGLSVGITVCLITYLFYSYETSFDHHHEKAEHTFRVVQHTQRVDQELFWNTTAYPLAAALRNDFTAFKHVTQAAGPMKRLFTLGDSSQQIKFEEEYVLFADQHYPEVFDLEWVSGDPRSALAGPNGVVLTERIAKKCFPDRYKETSIIGETLLLNNKDPLIVTGVVKNPPATINLKFNMLASYAFFKKHNDYRAHNWAGNYRGTTFVVLNNPTEEAGIEHQINDWKGNYLNEDDDQQISYFLQPLTSIHNETLYGSSPKSYQISQRTLDISMLVAAFILLVAIINYVNLSTSRAVTRSKEVGIRKAIGSGKRELMAQFIIENSLIVLISIVVSLAITQQALTFINRYLSLIRLDLHLEFIDLAFVLIVSFVAILLSTVYPSVVLSAFNPINALYHRTQHINLRGITFRKALTFFQFTLVQVFIISSIIIGLQLRYFSEKSPGFDTEGVVTVPLPSFDKVEIFKNLMKDNPEVAGVTVGSGPPMGVEDFALGTTYRLPSQPVQERLPSEMKIGDTDYLQFYGLELISGRNFTKSKPIFDEFIINEKLAASMGWTDPESALGKKLVINEGEATVIGVVKDFHNTSFQKELTPVVFMNWTAWQWEAAVKINSKKSLIFVEETWESLFPNQVFSYRFLDDSIAKEYVLEDLIYTGFNILSILAIIIGSLGLVGMMSFITLQKTKEVGVRKVLGATVFQIIRNLNNEFTLIVLISFLVAIPTVYYFMNEWLNGFSYRISLSSGIFLLGGLITYFVGSCISVFKSWKVAHTNPVESLRNE